MHRFDLSKYSGALYGGIKYGESNLVYGDFKMKPVTFGSPVLGTFSVIFKADFNNVIVNHDDEELVYTGTWLDGGDYKYTNTLNDTCTGYFTGTGFTLNYVANAGNTTALSVKINYLNDLEEPTETSIVVDQTTGSSATISMDLSMRHCTFEIKKTAAGTARISSLEIDCTKLKINTYVSYDGSTWEDPFYLNYSLTSPGIYEGVTSSFSGGSYPIKTKLDLEMTSGSFYSNIEIFYVNIYSESSGYTKETGQWKKIIDLNAAPLNFGNITWVSEIPDGSSIEIYTKTSDSIDFTGQESSKVYEIGKKNIRLTEGNITGSLQTTSFSPQQINEFCYYRYISFTSEEKLTQNTTWIKYYLVRSNSEIIEVTENTDFVLLALENEPVSLRVTMGRLNSQTISPQSISAEIGINVIYEEIKNISPILTDMANSCRLFADDPLDPEENQGTRKVIEISSIGFSVPPSISEEEYSFIDKSNRKEHIRLFWFDEPSSLKTNRTDILYSTALSTSIVHRYYGSGIVYYSDPILLEMSDSFYPTIPSNNYRYAYRLVNGWKQEIEGATKIDQQRPEIDMAWTIVDLSSGPGENYDSMISEKSKRNNYEYPQGELINDSISIESNRGIVTNNTNWKSESVQYKDKYVNPNYGVIQQNYTSTLTLPRIPSSVQVFSEPYKMEIIRNSVTMDEELVSENRLEKTFTLTILEITIFDESITKGIDNIDYLENSMTTSIDKISNSYGGTNDYTMMIYKNELGAFGNFENAIDGVGEGWVKDNPNGVCSVLDNEQTITTVEGEDTTLSLTLTTTPGSMYYFCSEIQNCKVQIGNEFFATYTEEYKIFDNVITADDIETTITATVEAEQENLTGKIKKIIVVDLTAIFSEGQERDLTWCRNNIEYTTSNVENIATANWMKVNNSIEWINGAPEVGEIYYVSYKYLAAQSADVVVSCDYTQTEKEKSIWESDVIYKNYYDDEPHETAVTCSPGIPFSATLPDINTVWEIPLHTTNLNYKVYDDNPLVQTYISGNTLIGTLNENIPSRNWHPFIGDGFYYKQKDEHYVFNEIGTFVIENNSIDPVLKTLALPVYPTETSPIIVEIPNIETRQVGFVDEEGNYVTYLTEKVILDGTPRIKLSYSNIDPSYTIVASTEDGEGFTILDTTPSDNIITMSIDDGEGPRTMTEKEAREHKGKELFVTYQPKDCYVVEYQEAGVLITFSEVYLEGNIYYEISPNLNNAIENIDMNPIVGLREKGFLYIESNDAIENPSEKRYIMIDANPKDIKRGEASTINIKTYDEFINPIKDTLTVTASDGVVLQQTEGTPEGTYIYTYVSPLINTGVVKISVTNGTITSETNIRVY
jgi:hypothetical protein